jgi:hypothetical protein
MNIPYSFAAELEKIAAQTVPTWTPPGSRPAAPPNPRGGTTMWTPPPVSASPAAPAAPAAGGRAARRGVREGAEAAARGAAKNLGSNPVAALVGGLTAAGLMTLTQRRDVRQDKLLRGLRAIDKKESSRRKNTRLIKTLAITGLSAGISGAAAPVLYRKAAAGGAQLFADLSTQAGDALQKKIKAGVGEAIDETLTGPAAKASFGDAIGTRVGRGIEDAEIGKSVLDAVEQAIFGKANKPNFPLWARKKWKLGPHR